MNTLATLFSKQGLIRTFEAPDNCPDCPLSSYEQTKNVRIWDTYTRCVICWERQAKLRLWFLLGFAGIIIWFITLGCIATGRPIEQQHYIISIGVLPGIITFGVLCFWHLHLFNKAEPAEDDVSALKQFEVDVKALESLFSIRLTKAIDCFTLEARSRQTLNYLAYEFVSSPQTMQSLSRMEFAKAFETLKLFGLTDSKWDAYMDYAERKHFGWFYEI